MIRLTAIFLVASASCWAQLHNGIRQLNPTGGALTDIPYSIGRMFAQGEFPSGTPCAAPYIDGTVSPRWQSQVVNTWPADGSTRYILIDFVNPSLGTSAETVDFRPSASCSSGGAALTKAAIQAASWEGDMRFVFNAGTANESIETRDLRTIFSALTENESCVVGATAGVQETSTTRKLRRGRDGPVLSELIVEDLCETLTYDLGRQYNGTFWANTGGSAYKSIHPYFVLTAYKDYPSAGNITVKVRFAIENPWTKKRQNQVYRARFRVGPSYGTTIYEDMADRTHTFGSVYSFGGDTNGGLSMGWATSTSVPEIVDDPNLPYVIYTKAIQSFVTEPLASGITADTMIPAEILNSLVASSYTKLGLVGGVQELPQFCRAVVAGCRGTNCCSFWAKNQTVPAGSHELAMSSTHFTRWFYLARNPTVAASALKDYWNQVMLGLTHSGANAPFYYRESRNAALYSAINADTPAFKALNEFGRTISIDAHPTEGLAPFSGFLTNVAGCTSGVCVPTGNGWVGDLAHQIQFFYPVAMLTGDFYWLRLLEGLGAYQQGLSSAASTTLTTRNGRMGCMGWGTGVAARGPAWRIRNIVMAAALMPSSAESENLLKQVQNTAACDEGYLSLTAADGAIQYNTTAGSAWRFGNDIWRLKTGASTNTFLTYPDNPWKVWHKRIVGRDNIQAQGDVYDATKINSAHSPWMTAYFMAAVSFVRDMGYNWFDALLNHIPKLEVSALKSNVFLGGHGYSLPTHKTVHARHEIVSATPQGSNKIRFNIPSHGYPAGTTSAGICCTSLSWPNGWHLIESTNGADNSVGTPTLSAVFVDANNVDVTLAAWGNPTGTYLADGSGCCTVSGQYKLYMTKRPSTDQNTAWGEDGGNFASESEFLAALHPRAKDRTQWPTFSPYRLYSRDAAYSDVAISLLSNIIDARTVHLEDAQRAFSKMKSLNQHYEWAFSPPGSEGCDGTLTPTSDFCGNMTWMIWPRPRIDGLVVTPGTTSLHFAFIAPTGDGARIAVQATPFLDSRTGSDAAATCKGRSCVATIGSLTTGTPYYYRITSGAMGGTGQTRGTVETQ